MAKRQEVLEYRKEIILLRKRLPNNYGRIAKQIDPDVDLVKLFNVAKGRSCDNSIMNLLRRVADLAEKNFAKKDYVS